MLAQLEVDFQGLSSPGIFFQFKDFPGFSRPVDTLITYEKRENLSGDNFNGGKAL
jgi:hypothetical protein